ncbi:DMP19 family protein [Flavobacterium tyrosinilyticum]|uniref:DMP19 family protein n=1 Tax=Flavobacterium tyrosinilyticum TaxID=1658740 RepID=UPI00202F1E40|nr:DUF4375 domain-containing protein [Flavobacterium tyrosinilyticum]MCM0665840.1 DUF4375 domain-containing protein [Flavobacterium tyrosinilyticum]
MKKKIILLIMIASILNLFGCKKKVETKITKPNFTEETINGTKDTELLEKVWNNISSKLSTDYEKEYESVLKLSKSEQAIYIIWNLEGEINNGGFNQYYFNSSGQFADLVPDALKLIHANKFADLVVKANNIYKKEYKNITKHQDGTLEGFSKSYDDNPLNKLDDEFYDLYKTEKLENLLIEYIRQNKSEFVDK